MKTSLLASGLLAIFVFPYGLSLSGGDVTGHAVITKRIGRKALLPTTYNLRGTPTPIAAADSESVNEFDRMVVMLQGRTKTPRTPETMVLEQRNGRFDPDLVIVPVGSTIQFPNADPIFHNVFSLSRAQSFDLGFYPKGQSRSVKFTDRAYCAMRVTV